MTIFASLDSRFLTGNFYSLRRLILFGNFCCLFYDCFLEFSIQMRSVFNFRKFRIEKQFFEFRVLHFKYILNLPNFASSEFWPLQINSETKIKKKIVTLSLIWKNWIYLFFDEQKMNKTNNMVENYEKIIKNTLECTL